MLKSREQPSDAELIRDCLSDRQRGWDRLIERYGRLVYSIPLRLGLPAADADDVFQIVWSIVLRRLESLRDAERLSAWLIRTTYRESWRRVRQRSRQASSDAAELDAAAPDEPAEHDIIRWERQELVHRGLGQLDERCRRLLTALFLGRETPPYEQLAEELGMRIGSIGPTRARCLQRLERILAKLGM